MSRFEKLKFYLKALTILPGLLIELWRQRLLALRHRWTYRAVAEPKDIVIIGGSFTGVQLARRLAESVPTGYRVTLIEKNSHLHYLFTFPRYSVAQGYEQHSFIPYDGVKNAVPQGALLHIQDTVVAITEKQVCLKSGERIDFAYLAICTGSEQPIPAKLAATEKEEGCKELRGLQQDIQAAQRIAIVGGGAVGIELATDIKSFYPEKDVTLIHSRNRLLPRFGMRLHEYVFNKLQDMGVHIRLNERPALTKGLKSISFSNGDTAVFDLVYSCSGQTANSAIIKNLAPSVISDETGQILVRPTLQIATDTRGEQSSLSNIFALGDVAATGGPKMARAGFYQSEVVVQNILALICGHTRLTTYKPRNDIEGGLKLTLGKDCGVMYLQNNDGSDILVPIKLDREDLDIEKGWHMMNVQFPPTKSK